MYRILCMLGLARPPPCPPGVERVRGGCLGSEGGPWRGSRRWPYPLTSSAARERGGRGTYGTNYNCAIKWPSKDNVIQHIGEPISSRLDMIMCVCLIHYKCTYNNNNCETYKYNNKVVCAAKERQNNTCEARGIVVLPVSH